MQKVKIITALTLPIVCLLLWVAVLCAKYFMMPEVVVRIGGYDPRDLLGGHYIAYTIDWDNTDCAQFSGGKCPKEDFANHSINSRWGEQHRFYIPEEHAQKLDDMFRRSGGNYTFEIVYKYASGITPLAKELRIDGKPWQETIINNSEGQDESNQN